MPIHFLQSSFNGGEVSPEMWARTNYKKYESSLKEMTNFYPRFCGGATNRAGTEFIAEVKDSAKKVKLLPFQFSTTQAYIVEVGNGYMRFYKDGGLIINTTANLSAWVTATSYALDKSIYVGTTIYRCILAHTSSATDEPGTGVNWETYWVQSNIVEITTAYNQNDIFNLKIAQSADTMYLCNNNYKPKTLTRSSHYLWALSDFENSFGPFRSDNVTTTTVTASATSGTVTVTASTSIFSSDMVGSLLKISHEVFGQVIDRHTNSNFESESIKCYGDWSFQITDPWRCKYTIYISNDNGTTWNVYKAYSCTDGSSAITDSGTVDHYCLLKLIVTESSDGAGNVTLSTTSFISDGFVKITGYTSGTVVTGTVITDSNRYIWGIADTTATDKWAIGAWNEEYGYPACAKFFQNRLAFANTPKDPLTIWFSGSSDYVNFRVHPTVQDDDAITSPLVSEGVNAITSMVSLGYMLAFTEGGLWRIGTGSESTAFTPTSQRATQQDYLGRSELSPLVVNASVLSCDKIGNSTHNSSYNAVTDKYEGPDLSVLASHLFRNHKIVDWAYAPSPDSVVWAVRDDGVLLSFSYLAEQDIWSWAKHVTDGKYESVSIIPGTNYSEVWFVIKRKINGTWKRYIERLSDRNVSIDPRDQFFIDSGLSYDNPITITNISLTSPVVVTAPSHGLIAGNIVELSDILGTTELNDNKYKVGVATTDTVTLLDMNDDTPINGSAFTAYEEEGHIRKCINSVSGLSHLEGKTVSILADGSVEPSQVVTNGSVPLSIYAGRIHIGLPYTSRLETLNIDYQRQDGTAQGRLRSIANVTARLEYTKGGNIGVNDNDVQAIEYEQNNWGVTPDLYTGDKKLTLTAGSDTEAHIVVTQTEPLPITVVALIAEVTIGD